MSEANSKLSVKRSALNVERSGAAGPRSASTEVDAANPWPGLAPYTEAQSAQFFGRDAEIKTLARRVQGDPLTVLFGQSGLGKSSLLQAGVFPRLRSADFCPVYIRLDYASSSRMPVAGLVEAGPGSATPATTPSLAEQVKQIVFAETARHGAWTQPGAARPGESLWEFFHHRDNRLVSPGGIALSPVLVFDQFEELFTLGGAAGAERQRAVAFMTELAELVENRPPEALIARVEQSPAELDALDFGATNYRVVITLREDFLPHLESLKAIMPALMDNRMRLSRMNGVQALEAVVKPGAGLVTEEVARAIVEFVAGARGGSTERLAELDVEPPLLSVICRELNERRRALGQTQITADLVSGNRREILTDFYERSVADLPEAMRTFVEDHLLTKSGFRDNLSLESVLEFPGVTRPLIDTLVNRRLLRIEDRLGVERVELTHDVLAEVIRASRDAHHQQLALAQAQARERVIRRRLWLAGASAAALLVGLAGVSWVAWRAVRAEREQARLRSAAERLAVISNQSRATAVAAQALTEQAREQAEGVLGFSLLDLREQLEDYGHLPLMLQVAERAVAYYEGLLKGLDSSAFRAGYARAMTALSAVLIKQGELARSRALREKSLAIFGELERANALTPAMRVDYGFALTGAALAKGSQRLFLEAVPYIERAEAVLQPAIADPEQSGRAQRQLAAAQSLHGWALLWAGGRAQMAVGIIERAIANAKEADGKPPLPRHPGLQATSFAWLLSWALRNANRGNEARVIDEAARVELRTLLVREPYLFTAINALAMCAYNVANKAMADWDYARADETLKEQQRLYQEMLKLDPKNSDHRFDLGLSWVGNRRIYELRNRDYAAAERAILTGLPFLVEEPTDEFNLNSARLAMVHLAGIYAATGRDAEADEALTKADAFEARANQGHRADSVTYALSAAARAGSRRTVERARLNWVAVRRNAEETLAALSQLKPTAREDTAWLRTLQNDLYLDLLTVAFAQSDYAAARRALDLVTSLRGTWSPRPESSMQSRFLAAGQQLMRCQVLFRAGEIAEARELFVALWPEVEAVFAKAPEVINNQLRYAWALWIKSEVETGADAAARRALLERAASYLRPAAAAGKLNRYELEVLLPEIDAGLAGKPAFVPSGRLITEGLPALRARAEALRKKGDYAAAEPIEREILALTIKEQGEEGRDVVGRRSLLADTLLRLGKLKEAEELARVVLAGREKNELPGTYNLATVHRRLGSVLVAQKRYAEAEPLLLQACESTRLRITRSGRSQSETNLLTEGVNSLVELYTATGRPEKAAEWKKILATQQEQRAP